MLRTAFLSLILLVSLTTSTTSIIRRKLSRRQYDPQYCNAIEGFECKCSYYRVTCTNDRDLSGPIKIVQDERHKYQSVELVINAPRDIHVNEYTFEPVKELYKPDGENLEFRVKFERFTALHLSSPGVFNRVFPDGLPANARKHMALEIYNPEIQPHDHVNLFQNLRADSLELYALYPFRGSFQELFQGADIKYLRLSGGEIRSDPSQSFTGNIGRLELAKQASSLSVQNFPAYPAHELVINAYYVSEFNNEHPANYANLGELRVYSPGRIPANAFRQYPNIHTLSVQTDADIDPQAFDGLNKLEKLTIKDTQVNPDVLNKLSNVKEFETNIEKLDATTQCRLIEKLANGQVAIQAIPNGRECTCLSAYLDTATGRTPCDAQDCNSSPCAAIRNNYDAATRTFKTPPAIRRSDGSDALRPREPRVYTAPAQIAPQDQQKLQNAIPPQVQPPAEEDLQRPDTDDRRPHQPYDPNQPSYPQDQQGGHDHAGHQHHDGDSTTIRSDDYNRPDGDGGDNRPDTDTGVGQPDTDTQNPNIEGGAVNGTDTTTPPKKGMSWLPIILIAAAIVGLLLIGLVILLLRRRRANTNKGYNPTATNEPRAEGVRA